VIAIGYLENNLFPFPEKKEMATIEIFGDREVVDQIKNERISWKH